VQVKETTSVAEASAWLPEVTIPHELAELTLLLATANGHPAGYAELIQVQTLLYRGIWIESLVASAGAVREALIHQIVNRAIAAGLDEIGAMVPSAEWSLQQSLVGRGFRSLGEFHWFSARLPLPGNPYPLHQAVTWTASSSG
jgi:hypothetical protein